MERLKVWVILGAGAGLGYAAVKYLISKGQVVIALTGEASVEYPIFGQAPGNLHVIDTEISDTARMKKTLNTVIAKYGAVDHIINNADYGLFSGYSAVQFSDYQNAIASGNGATIKLIKALVPFLRKDPKGSLINIPPQLCLATVKDKNHAKKLSSAMEAFLIHCYAELQALDCRLNFLRPGERLPDLTD